MYSEKEEAKPTSNVIASFILVQASPTVGTDFGCFAYHLLKRLVLLNHLLCSLFFCFPRLIRRACFVVMHSHLAKHAVSVGALLAGEYIAVFFGAEEASPATFCTGQWPILFAALATRFGCLVEPSINLVSHMP